ncbi:MAG: tRNA (adenosine(37)-N6)-dimethylallyltransferase MiaA, partial [Parcubacteria group bacterium CG_4_10_14_0_2_um_filter_41_6]
MNQLITILGPTASGKSTLGIELAQDLNGEIVSADSRQVFRGLDIGSGKVTNEEQAQVPHYLLDVVDPMDDFSVSHFQKLAFTAIDDIIGRNKLPFLVGGTALYIYSVIDNYKLQDIAPDPKLRKQFEKKSLSELQAMVPDGALNKDDYNNPRRLIRAIEKLEAGVPIEPQKGPQKYENIIFGIDFPREELYQRIDQRVDERLKDGMIEEVENLRANGVSDEWLVSLGLEYKWITEFLQGKWQRDEMIKRLKGAIHAFAR